MCTAYTAAPVHSLFAPEGHPPMVDRCSVISPVHGGGYAAFTACPVHSLLSLKGNQAIVDRGALTHHHKGAGVHATFTAAPLHGRNPAQGFHFSQTMGLGVSLPSIKKVHRGSTPGSATHPSILLSVIVAPLCALCALCPPPPSLLQSTYVWTSCGS